MQFLACLDEAQEELLYYPGIGVGVGVSKKFNVKVFYVMGKALSGKLSCPCDMFCFSKQHKGSMYKKFFNILRLSKVCVCTIDGFVHCMSIYVNFPLSSKLGEFSLSFPSMINDDLHDLALSMINDDLHDLALVRVDNIVTSSMMVPVP